MNDAVRNRMDLGKLLRGIWVETIQAMAPELQTSLQPWEEMDPREQEIESAVAERFLHVAAKEGHHE